MKLNLIIKTYELDKLILSESLTGELEKNILKYSNETDIFEINLAENNFKKENLESIFEIDENKCILTLKDLNKNFEIPIIHNFFEIKDHKITIIYRLESQENDLKIEIEMGDVINV